MSLLKTLFAIAGVMATLSPLAAPADQKGDDYKNNWRSEQNVQLGPRPFFLSIKLSFRLVIAVPLCNFQKKPSNLYRPLPKWARVFLNVM
jgi:hypothetical protein